MLTDATSQTTSLWELVLQSLCNQSAYHLGQEKPTQQGWGPNNLIKFDRMTETSLQRRLFSTLMSPSRSSPTYKCFGSCVQTLMQTLTWFSILLQQSIMLFGEPFEICFCCNAIFRLCMRDEWFRGFLWCTFCLSIWAEGNKLMSVKTLLTCQIIF